MLDALDGDQALFFRTLSDRVGSTDDPALVAALWELVWAGLLTNDTLAPLRSLLGATGRTGPARRRPAPRLAVRAGGPAGDAVPDRSADRGRPVVPGAARATTTRPGGRTRRPRCCSTGTAC